MPDTLHVAEIFRSIQGESTWAGLPCVFVRLAGCPLRCRWCDTVWAREGGVLMSIDEIIMQVTALGGDLVEITGGEPLWQEAAPALAKALIDIGLTVLCETSGAFRIDRLPAGTIRIMDVKCPGSGESDRMDWLNLERLDKQDEVKFVIADRADFTWSADIIRRYNLSERCGAIMLSPVTAQLNPRDLARWILEEKLRVRIQLQLHKMIWPDGKEGL